MIVELIDYHKPLIEHKKLGGIKRKLVDGRYFAGTNQYNHQVLIDANRVVGYCHYAEHEGLLEVNDFTEHRCLQKHCRYFQPFTAYPYLKSHPELLAQIMPNDENIQEKVKKQNEAAIRRKQNIAHMQDRKKQKAAKQESRINNIKLMTEQLFAETDSYFMHVVRVEQIHQNNYKIYLVSDEDRRYHLAFLSYVEESLKKMYPGKYIFHRIPSLYGTYATKYDIDHRNKARLVI